MKRDQSGYVLVLTIIVVFVLTSIGISILTVSSAKYATSRRAVAVNNAIYAAEAGVSNAMYMLSINKDFSGHTTEQDVYSSATQGKATFTTTVSGPDASDIYTVISTGRAYKLPGNTTPFSTKKLEVKVMAANLPVQEAIFVGAGGLHLEQNSRIPKGSVSTYVKGQVLMESNSQIGSASESVYLDVSNSGCGASVNWPQPCGSSSPPIIFNDTLSQSSIFGTVCATNQISDVFINTGPTGAGLLTDCLATDHTMPFFDKKAFIDTLVSLGATPQPASNFECDPSNHDIDVPANTWISGDWNIDGGMDECEVEIEGDVYVDGSITTQSNGSIQVSDSTNSNRPTIVLNGAFNAGTSQGSLSAFAPNNDDTPANVISFYSTNGGCSSSNTTPSITQASCLSPQEAEQSAEVMLGHASQPQGAFNCSSSAEPQDMSGAVFYAYYGSVNCLTGGGVTFAGVGAQGIHMAFGELQLVDNNNPSPFIGLLTWENYKVVGYNQRYN